MNFGERLEEGKVYRIDLSLNPTNAPCGMFDRMNEFDGVEISLIDIVEEFDRTIRYDGWFFAKDLLVEVEGKRKDRILKEDTRKYTNFKKGDLVKVRTLDNLREHYYSNDVKVFTLPRNFYYNDIRKIGGYIGEIVKVAENDEIIIDFENSKNEYNYDSFIFCSEMLEIVEEGYRQRVEEELRAKILSSSKATDDEIIAEMISKVDVDKIRKILAGALRIKGTAFVGVDKMLNQWAVSKKDIYLGLGRQLTITKEAEYTMDLNEARERRYALMQSFPRFL